MRQTLALALFTLAACFTSSAWAATQLIPRISITTPPGWDASIVARTSDGASSGDPLTTAPALPTSAPVWVNWAVHANAAINGYWADQLWLDGQPTQTLPRWNSQFVAREWLALDAGPLFLPGGRHTLTALADVTQSVEEARERGDNRVDRQLIWDPFPLGAVAADGSVIPPPALPDLPGLEPNNHAFRYGAAGDAWAVALQSAADLDLVLFDDMVSSTNGLSHQIARSTRPQGALDLIVGGAAAAAGDVFPTVQRNASGTGSGYALQSTRLQGRVDTDGDAFWDAESLLWGQFVNLYAADLQAGVAYPMSVFRMLGSHPLHFAIFPAAGGFLGSLDQALVISQVVPGQDYEVASFTPSESGRHLIAVYRDATEHLISRFQFAIGSHAVGVEGAPSPSSAFEAMPNPTSSMSRVRFMLPASAHVRLDVLDVQGRLQRSLFDGDLPAGPHERPWDLRDDAGARVPPGLYWARIRGAGPEQRVRISVVQ